MGNMNRWAGVYLSTQLILCDQGSITYKNSSNALCMQVLVPRIRLLVVIAVIDYMFVLVSIALCRRYIVLFTIMWVLVFVDNDFIAIVTAYFEDNVSFVGALKALGGDVTGAGEGRTGVLWFGV